MRTNLTASEKQFKSKLEQSGIDFDCQMIVGFYIADFCIPRRMLIVEIDGASHYSSKEYDERRDGWLKSLGFRVKRIKNEDVSFVDVKLLVEEYNTRPSSIFVSAMAEADSQYKRATVAKGKKKEWKELTTKQRNNFKKKQLNRQKALSIRTKMYRQEALSNLEKMRSKGILDAIEYQNRRAKYK